jgi:hypothetical protein
MTYFKVVRDREITFKEVLVELSNGNCVEFETYDSQTDSTDNLIYRVSCENKLQVLYLFNNTWVDTCEFPNTNVLDYVMYLCDVKLIAR